MRVRTGAGPLARTFPAPLPVGEAQAKGGLTTLNRLRCFQVVVEEAGFKRATARLHITQPALSYQMKQLEEEMGAELFHRRPGGVTLTEAGRLLFAHVQRVTAAVSAAERAVKELPATGDVRIGTVTSIATYFLPQLLSGVRRRHAAMRPVELVGLSVEVVEALLANRLDLAILADPREDPRLRYEPLFEESVSLISGRSHPFFGAACVTPDQLAGASFVALSRQTPTGALVARHLDALGIAVEPVVSTDNVETLKRLVEIGLGAAFLPDMVTERDVVSDARPGGSLGRSGFEPGITRRIVLVTREQPRSSPAVAAFVEEVRSAGAAWPGAVKPRG